jgi:transcriptional regulator with XRE-family HTH domain
MLCGVALERGGGYPDIELLPALASIFRVSTDELLGVDAHRGEAAIRERIKRAEDLCESGRRQEGITLLREVLGNDARNPEYSEQLK